MRRDGETVQRPSAVLKWFGTSYSFERFFWSTDPSLTSIHWKYMKSWCLSISFDLTARNPSEASFGNTGSTKWFRWTFKYGFSAADVEVNLSAFLELLMAYQSNDSGLWCSSKEQLADISRSSKTVSNRKLRLTQSYCGREMDFIRKHKVMLWRCLINQTFRPFFMKKVFSIYFLHNKHSFLHIRHSMLPNSRKVWRRNHAVLHHDDARP